MYLNAILHIVNELNAKIALNKARLESIKHLPQEEQEKHIAKWEADSRWEREHSQRERLINAIERKKFSIF